jgi:RimJ/RimL family protein N-acetyltransferase
VAQADFGRDVTGSFAVFPGRSFTPKSGRSLKKDMSQTQHVILVPQTRAEVIAMIDAMEPVEKAKFSADWLAQLEASTATDVWVHGFSIVHRESQLIVGKCVFKGPPDSNATVEIAYMVEPEHRCKGYATEAAQRIVAFAFQSGQVRVVRAHTLPEHNASARVLTRSGFRNLGEVIDPEDGLVWRWELSLDAQA